MKKKQFDFGGWATKNDLLCADGRTIRRDAFKDDDGRTVPLVYMHNHEDPRRVIGHALLENREEGVYAYCSLNNTDVGQHIKECIRHQDINGLSIYANKLTQQGGNVLHGTIRELSIVLAGANPGAVIEFPLLAHGEESETEAYIWPGDDELDFEPELSHSEDEEAEEARPESESEPEAKEEPTSEPEPDPELAHADEPKKEEPKEEPAKEESKKDEKEETVQDILDTLTPKQRKVVDFLMTQVLADGEDAEEEDADEEVEHADAKDEEKSEEDADDDETVQDVLDSMTEKQRNVVEFLLGKAAEVADENKKKDEEEEKEASHSDDENEGEDTIMHKNLFDNGTMTGAEMQEGAALSHAQIETLMKDGKRLGSLRASVLEHSAEYGIEQIDWLFPEDKNVSATPGFIQRDMGWVTTVMQGISHTPFSRIKTIFADITEEEARAKGYIKGKKKKNEVFTLLKRSTDPQTIYKKQKLDRDDIVDITDFDVVAWMKQEMRIMLNEEIARAILIGDGRDTDSDDHISEDHIRSVFRDNKLYAIHKTLTPVQGEAAAKTLIKTVRLAWSEYKGRGNCVAFIREDALADLLLLEDGIGHFLYPTKEIAASVLGVREIVPVPVMADTSTLRNDTTANKWYRPLVIILNLQDYNVGADKGGSVNMFEDFDIDFNAQKYLIETRCSGALVRPYSAIVVEEETEAPDNDDDDDSGDDNP